MLRVILVVSAFIFLISCSSTKTTTTINSSSKSDVSLYREGMKLLKNKKFEKARMKGKQTFDKYILFKNLFVLLTFHDFILINSLLLEQKVIYSAVVATLKTVLSKLSVNHRSYLILRRIIERNFLIWKLKVLFRGDTFEAVLSYR